jgi:fructose-specific component phosphotransferase system IIB-like protein
VAEFPVLVSLSSLVPVAVNAGMWCWRRHHQSIEKKNESALVLSLGRSTLCEQLRGSDVIVLDIDNLVRASMRPDELAAFDAMAKDDPTKQLKYLVAARAEYLKIKTSFGKSKRILSVCPTLECANYLGIELESVFMCAPAGQLYERIMEGLDAPTRKRRDEERLAFLLSARNLLAFNSYEELYALVRTSWGVKSKL